ncbi:unnamed protein product [Sympodiomycopsis kandeliae]
MRTHLPPALARRTVPIAHTSLHSSTTFLALDAHSDGKAFQFVTSRQSYPGSRIAIPIIKMFGNNDFDMYTDVSQLDNLSQHQHDYDDKNNTDTQQQQSFNNLFDSTQPTIMVESSQDPTVDSYNTTTNSTASTSVSFPTCGDYNSMRQQQQSTDFTGAAHDFSEDSNQSLSQYWSAGASSQRPVSQPSQASQSLQLADFDSARDTLSVSASPMSAVTLASSPQLSGMRAVGRANSFTSVHSTTSSTGLSGVFDSQLDMGDTRFGESLRPSTASSINDSLSDLHSSPASFADDTALGNDNDDFSSPTESKATSSVGPHRKARFKCSPEQLEQLHAFFAANRNPTGKIRKELATRIAMPERSVQIWFQNRRAKLKQRGDVGYMASSSMPLPSSSSPSVKRSGSAPKMSKTASVSTLMAGSHPNATGMSRSSSVSLASGSGRLPNARKAMKASKALSSQESVNLIPTVSICIGTWRRVRPLTCFFSRNHRLFGWTMRSDSVGFKMECPYSSVREITFNGPISPSMSELAEQICEPLGLLYIRLQRPPMFNMQTFKSASRPGEREPTGTTWRQCEDFTEGRQGTMVLSHILSGPFQALREVVLKLRASDEDIASKLYMNDDITLHSQPQQPSQQQQQQQQQQPPMYGQAQPGGSFNMSGGAVDSANWISGSEDDDEHHPQLRLDQRYFESISDNHQHAYPHMWPSGGVGAGPSPHIAVMPPTTDFDSHPHQLNTYGGEISEAESQSGHLNFPPRMSIQSHHSAPSAFGINNGGNNNGGDMNLNARTSYSASNMPSGTHLQSDSTGYDVLHGLGLSGVEGMYPGQDHCDSNANPNWFQPGHLSAPAAPQSGFVDLPWQSSPLQQEHQPQ